MINKLKIGWKIYDVVEKEPNGDLIMGGDLCYGKIQHDERKIFINSSYDAAQKITTLIHEAIHGIEDLMNLELEEKQVSAMANGIATLIADNPQLIKEFKTLYKSASE